MKSTDNLAALIAAQKWIALESAARETLIESMIDCDIHGESKAVSIFGRALKCEKCIEAAMTESAAQEIGERDKFTQEQKIERLFRCSGIPVRYLESTFDNYRILPGEYHDYQKNVVEKAISFAAAIGENNWKALTLYGDSGTGKTHLLTAVLTSSMRRGLTAKYVSFPSLNDRFGRARAFSSEETREDILNQMLAPDILGIDEVGLVGAIADEHAMGVIYDVINIRYGALKPVVLSSNSKIAELKLMLGDPVIDRLREDGGFFFPMDWESYRKNGGGAK